MVSQTNILNILKTILCLLTFVIIERGTIILYNINVLDMQISYNRATTTIYREKTQTNCFVGR